MTLTIDIGNTNINFALFNKGRMFFCFKLATKENISKFDFRSFKRSLTKKAILPKQIKKVIICSVVPKATKILKKSMVSFLKIKPLVLGTDIKVPIKNLYRKPQQVGQDRLVAAYAATKLFCAPVIVVDFGTATTLDVVSKKGEYIGGIIIPGIGMSLEALHEKTALLPKITLKKPKGIVGKDTVESVLSGIFFGYASLVDGLILKIAKLSPTKPSVVFTGGFAQELSGYCSVKHKVEENLIAFGLQLIYLQYDR